MAVDKRYLDPTGSGSKGAGVFGSYKHPTDTKATIQAANYFDNVASELSTIRVDALLIVATDATFWAKVSVSNAGVVTISALDAF